MVNGRAVERERLAGYARAGPPRVPARIQVAAICQLAYLVLEIALDADAGGPASIALRVVDADRIRLLLHHVVVVVATPWAPSP